MSIAEVEARISSRELTEWEAYERVAGPLGAERLDYLFARLMAQTAAIWRGRDDPAPAVRDFLPQWDPAPVSTRTVDEQAQALLSLARALGATPGGE